MKTKDTFTPEDFDKFLRWLDKENEEAGHKYTYIHRKLIQWFAGRRCVPAEDLADEVIARVIFKTKCFVEPCNESNDELEIRIDDRLPYFYAVAFYVYKEHLRDMRSEPVPYTPAPEDPEILERRDRCLESCLVKLPKDQSDLIAEYVNNGNRTNKEHRKELAASLGITLDALRIRTCRIRKMLRDCMEDCLEKAAFAEM